MPWRLPSSARARRGRVGMSDTPDYGVPWPLLVGLTHNLRTGEPKNIGDFTAAIVKRMPAVPRVEGIENLPADPRFILAANHYQRKGLWILHTAAALTQALAARYKLPDPPLRWLVTANWPRWRFLGRSVASPGDLVLPRVAKVLQCYPVPFAGTNPAATARSYLRLRRELPSVPCPVGIFPEGAAGRADSIGEALPGVTRLMQHLGRPVVPVRVAEDAGNLILRFGRVTSPELIMASIRAL